MKIIRVEEVVEGPVFISCHGRRFNQEFKFEFLINKVSIWFEAKKHGVRTKVLITQAPEKYQTLIGKEAFAYFSGESITLTLAESEEGGNIRLRQTALYFPRNS